SSPRPVTEAAPLAPVREGETPYGAFLAVRLAPKDEAAAWKDRRAAILAAVPADRRDAMDALFAPPPACRAITIPPPMRDPRDLGVGGKFAASVGHVGAPVLAGGTTPPIALGDWLPRYEAMVDAVSTTKTVWANVASLLYERGALYGLNPSGTALYRQVT